MLSSKIFEILAKFFHNHFVLKVEVSGELDRTFKDIKNYLFIDKLLSEGKAVVNTIKNFGSLMIAARSEMFNLRPKAVDAEQKLTQAKVLYGAIQKCQVDPNCAQLLVCCFWIHKKYIFFALLLISKYLVTMQIRSVGFATPARGVTTVKFSAWRSRRDVEIRQRSNIRL